MCVFFLETVSGWRCGELVFFHCAWVQAAIPAACLRCARRVEAASLSHSLSHTLSSSISHSPCLCLSLPVSFFLLVCLSISSSLSISLSVFLSLHVSFSFSMCVSLPFSCTLYHQLQAHFRKIPHLAQGHREEGGETESESRKGERREIAEEREGERRKR